MRFFILFVSIFLSAALVFAQDTDDYGIDSTDEEPWDFSDEPPADTKGTIWISPGLETALYSDSYLCYGGGLALAYGRGVSIGIKAAYFFNFENRIDVLELGFLLRFYLLGSLSYTGPFLQLSGGQSLFLRGEDSLSIPAQWGTIYGSMEAGWRFPLKNDFFIEPFIRGGYPFMYGGGISTGVIF